MQFMMSETKWDLFKREFPFLKDYVNPKKVEWLSVSRIDADFMREYRVSHGYLGILWQRQPFRIIFLDRDGMCVTEVDGKPGFLGWLRRWRKRNSEAVADAILRAGELAAERISYALQIELTYTDGLDITVYKLPKRTTLSDLIRESRENAQKRIEEEKSSVCEVLEKVNVGKAISLPNARSAQKKIKRREPSYYIWR